MLKTAVAWIAAGGLAAGSSKSVAAQWSIDQAGLRVGFPATRLHQHFLQVEAHTLIDVHCQLNLGRQWIARSGIDLSAGALMRNGQQGFVGALGPAVVIGRPEFPVEFVCGSGATFLSRHVFDNVSYGIPFQFTSHAGFIFHLGSRWNVTYRFQHMSNASISPDNPGLDLHSVGLGYQF